MKTIIIADSCCDLTTGLLNNIDVRRVSFQIDIAENHFTDNHQLNPLSLLSQMHACKSAVKTACPSPYDFLDNMRTAESCFVITISSCLSGSYHAAMAARSMALEETPDKKIHVFDSKSAASGETCVALRIQECVESGLAFEETVKDVTAYIDSLHTHFVLTNLDNLMKNGRLSKLKGALGMMLSIYPILADDGNGEIVMLEKVRGLKTAMCRLAEIVRENMDSPLQKTTTLVISHCNCEERALALKEQLRSIHKNLQKIIVVPAGGLSTVYANDGGIVLSY
jgi:DegV family protein with EDD domain